MMRVIAGSARRIQLVTPPGLDTRPTTDRIKETLFNILAPDIYDVDFLDLFAGSGAIGIEALSRGGRHAVFVEKNHNAISCIKQNLQKTKLGELADVYESDVYTAIRKLAAQDRHFDIIFADPPYEGGYYAAVLRELLDLASEDTLIIVEAPIEYDFSFASELGYEIEREKNYKSNKHIFLRKLPCLH